MGYEHYREHLQRLPLIEQHLYRIANALEGLLQLKQQETGQGDPDRTKDLSDQGPGW